MMMFFSLGHSTAATSCSRLLYLAIQPALTSVPPESW